MATKTNNKTRKRGKKLQRAGKSAFNLQDSVRKFALNGAEIKIDYAKGQEYKADWPIVTNVTNFLEFT